ncbi:kinase-like domain-containing protein [Aspergillus alliaceus]|uniref:kinase-like domain-containing protein n=1 Tax=Petromyces alliaceus TaxID=209559 RepID=UPI0012A4E99E|nr:kinase-like domain-containing protein [Aspergillus alliaceus]KAB8236015.1 kinase-like domain-containing protein [Aspergillus alliaceus]
MRVFEDQYKVTSQKLGSGGFGQVHMAFRKDTGQQLACKIVDLRDLRNRIVREAEDERSRYFTENGVSISGNRVLVARFYDSLQKKIQEKLEVYNREARILESLCHPNIISIEKVIHSSNTIYLFQELVTAGDLFSYIQYKGGRLDDIEAAVVVRQVLMALDYLHQREIVHRDLKPDNILMTSLADGCRVVLTDFGCARLLQPTAERMFTITGTFDYNAPEIFKYSTQGYTKAVDLWSLGCVTAVLLTGDIPFKNSLTADPTGLARRNDLEKLEADLDWNKTGQRARDFVHKLLVFDEAKRMDVSQSLNHSWFTNPAHRGEFEALYQRAIRHWRPRTHEGPLIANLCTLSKSPKHSSEFRQTPRSDGCSRADSDQSYNEQQLMSQEGTSSISPASVDYDLRREHSASLSTTLSDPELPPHRWIGSIESACSLMDTPDSVQHEQGFIRNSPIQNMP